jgi:TATA-box binding protein (TBP) (component of TFIID and TFIIIB)
MASCEIVNCVAYFSVREKNCNETRANIDLHNLQSLASGDLRVAYNPTQFGCARVRMPCASVKRGEILALVFSTGKVVVPKLSSHSEARIAADEIARRMSIVLGKTMEARDIKTPNLAGSCKTDPVDLETMALTLGSEIARYEPADFAACFVNPSKGSDGVRYLVFETGKIVVTGCQSEEALRESMSHAQKMCADFLSL